MEAGHLLMDDKKVFALVDERTKGWNKHDLAGLIVVFDKFRAYRKKELTLEKLDEFLLFTPGKVKNTAYRIDEEMYPTLRSIRGQIEVTYDYTKEDEKEDIDAIFEGVMKQAKERQVNE